MTTGQRLRKLRLVDHLTQQQMADIFNLHRVTISGWEADHWVPSWKRLKRLAEHFGVTVKFLLYGDDEGENHAT